MESPFNDNLINEMEQTDYANDIQESWMFETPFLEPPSLAAWQQENESFSKDENYDFSSEDVETKNNSYDAIGYVQGEATAYDEEHIANVIQLEAAKIKQTCDGRVCWAKSILNKQQPGLNLPENNSLDEPTKNAIAAFQDKNGLTKNKMIDAPTERALLEADALEKYRGTAAQKATADIISAAKSKIEDWTAKGIEGVKNKPKHILNSFRDPRKVYAFVLHHMAFKRKGRISKQYSDPLSYLSTGAHFCIMLDGRILQLHPISRMIWHGNCLSPRSVAVEFEGNFPNIKGKWWIDKDSTFQNKDIPTQAQYDAGKFLTSYLKTVLGTTHILAHRQSSDSRENDPGPDIWYNVGQWAMDNLGLSDGGETFKCGTGNAILPAWRTWENKTSTLINREFNDAEDEVLEMETDWENFPEQTALNETSEVAEWENSEMFENEAKNYKQASTRNANTFLTLIGDRQGSIKGGVTRKGLEGSIAVYQVHHEISSPRDAASGMATGKRVHKPLVITKEVDVASVKLMNALVTNERIKEVVINFYQSGNKSLSSGSGVEVNYYRIKLTDAAIINISNDLSNSQLTVLEKVEFVYQKIEWQYLAGTSLSALDSTIQNKEFESYETEEEITTDFGDAYRQFEEEVISMNFLQETGDTSDLNNKSLNETSSSTSSTFQFEPATDDLLTEDVNEAQSHHYEHPRLIPEQNNLVTDWSKAIKYNNYYSSSLGWNKYVNQIYTLLVPFSGQQNAGLSPEAFAEALSIWQKNNSLYSDGVLGPKTWEVIKPLVTGTVSATLQSSSIVAPKPCISTFANELPKHLEPRLMACTNILVPSINTLYLFEKTLQANLGPIWIKRLNSDLKTFLTYLYPKVNLTIELWRFVTIPKGNMRSILEPLSKYLKQKLAGEFSVSIIGPIASQPTIEKISGTSLNKFVSSVAPLTSKNLSYYWHVYATFPADVKNNFRELEWSNIDKFSFNESTLSVAQKQLLKVIASDIIESWVSTSDKRYTKIELAGHTDIRGTEKFNLDLGKKRAQAAAEFIQKEILSLAPQYFLDPAKMAIEYEILSYGETRPISKKPPIVHEFNRRVEVTLIGTPVAPEIPLDLKDVITKCLKIIAAKKQTINPDFYKRIHCLLNKMLMQDVDDRYITGQVALNIFNSNLFPKKDEWFRLRFFFTSQALFNKKYQDNDIFQRLISIDQTIQSGVDEISRKVNSHTAILPLPLPKAFEDLTYWVSNQAKNKDSIYSCY